MTSADVGLRPLTIDDLLVVAECQRLMTEYGLRLDTGRGASVADLFTEDGVYITPRAESRGRDQLRAFFALRDDMDDRISHHVMTNPMITVHGPDLATSHSVAIEYRSDDGSEGALRSDTRPGVVGDYEDTFVRTEEGWRFKERRVLIDFQRSGEQFLAKR